MTTTKEKLIGEVDKDYLYDWYLHSIANDVEPVWTEKHIDELFEDFYLIPKKN